MGVGVDLGVMHGVKGGLNREMKMGVDLGSWKLGIGRSSETGGGEEIWYHTEIYYCK